MGTRVNVGMGVAVGFADAVGSCDWLGECVGEAVGKDSMGLYSVLNSCSVVTALHTPQSSTTTSEYVNAQSAKLSSQISTLS